MPNYTVFISYRGSGSGGLLGKEIYTDLRHCKSDDGEPDIVPFFAPACIQKGEDFKRAIDTVLKSVSCVILILSPGYFENCRLEDDMVRFELETALANPNISFIPVVMDGFSFEDEIKDVEGIFEEEDIYRFKHINAIHHHGVYDFNTEADVVPALRKTLEEKRGIATKKTGTVRFDTSSFEVARGRRVYFGNYPRHLLRDEALVHKIYEGLATGATKKEENRYLYEGKTYYSVRENRFNKRTFDEERAEGSYNFYRVEPIRWIEIYTGGKYSVLITEEIIDARMFNLDRNAHRNGENEQMRPSNDWEVSFIRRWLNSEFYYDSFSEAERSYIQYAQISNGRESGYPGYARDRAPTVDKVFLVSHEEMYRFGGGCAHVSDFARSRGAYSSTSATCDGFGDWWTRSPGNIDSSVENVDRRGCLDAPPFCNYVNDTAAGVRPCIVIDRSALNNGDEAADRP